MKPRLRHLVAVAIVALTTIPSGWAQGPPPGRPEGGPVERFHEPAIPGLNADQTRRIRELREESGSKLASLGLELRNYRRSLETLYRSYQLDVNAARRLNRQINDVQKRMLEQHLRV